MSKEETIELAKEHLNIAKDFCDSGNFWRADTELVLASYYLKEMPVEKVRNLILEIKELKTRIKNGTNVFNNQSGVTL
ncbi:MAG: hypothetical protein IJX26_04775 [Clostridia bacterium]|nr:hypothetical protein [Clostridia bacterium]